MPFFNIFYPRLKAVVANSKGIACDLQGAFKLSNVITIANGVDLERVKAKSVAPIPSNLVHIFSKPVLVNVAGLGYPKNPELCLRAHAKAIRQGVDHNLLFVGDGPLRSRVVDAARKLGVQRSVFFSGYLENPYPVMAAARGLVLSSKFEGFGLVLVEALALGLPVVATDCLTGPREVLGDGYYGVLVPQDSVEGLANAIRDLLTKESMARELRLKGPQGAERYDVRHSVQQMERLFAEVLQRG